jgi:hypothetical protein
MTALVNPSKSRDKTEIELLNDTRAKILEQVKKEFAGSDLALLTFLVNTMKKEVNKTATINQFGLEDETFEAITLPISEIAKIYKICGDNIRDDVIKAIQLLNFNIVDKYPYTKKTKKGEIRIKYSTRYTVLFDHIHYDIYDITFNFNKYIFWLTSYRNVKLIF